MTRSTLAGDARYLATRAYSQSDGDAPGGPVEELLEYADCLQPGGASPVEALGWRVRRAIGPRRAGCSLASGHGG